MKEIKKYQMQELSEELTSADFHGFTLQSGYWFGKNLRGQFIATSTWVSYGAVAIYVKSETGWKLQWHEVDAWYFPEEFKKLLEKQVEIDEMFDLYF